MKHSTKITLALLMLFFFAQIIGLIIVTQYVDVNKSLQTGVMEFESLPSIAGYNLDRPEMEQQYSFIYILIAVILGTLLILGIIKWGKLYLWKAWFFFAVVLCLTIAFAAFFSDTIALVLGAIFAYIKVFRRSLLIQNLTELFIYGGLAVIFVPVINLWAMFALLVVISFYDMYAVWQSKHMIKMAKFQTNSGVFAGLLLPYSMPKEIKNSKKQKKSKSRFKFNNKKSSSKKFKSKKTIKITRSIRTAVLGGGDIGFPLLFMGVVFKTFGFWPALIIAPFSTASLFLLLWLGKKDRFYPAMPFLSLGCLTGYIVMLGVLLLF